jgi:hypothetical protein
VREFLESRVQRCVSQIKDITQCDSFEEAKAIDWYDMNLSDVAAVTANMGALQAYFDIARSYTICLSEEALALKKWTEVVEL